MIYWLTGQPGAGKTTLANWILSSFPTKSILVDGDDIREIFVNKDYSEEGRKKNIEKAQILSKFLHHKGYTVVVSLVSPFRDQREDFKTEMGDNLMLMGTNHLWRIIMIVTLPIVVNIIRF
jgi:adenylylsulfate kinase